MTPEDQDAPRTGSEPEDPRAQRKIARPKRGTSAKDSITPEMLAMAEALANPEGDPYDNARKMGFYCEQCG